MTVSKKISKISKDSLFFDDRSHVVINEADWKLIWDWTFGDEVSINLALKGHTVTKDSITVRCVYFTSFNEIYVSGEP